MKNLRLSSWASLGLGVWLTAAATLPAAAAESEQALKNLMQKYLQQMSRHDASGLPLAADINARENTDAIKIGDGLWKSVDSVLPGLTFADAKTGEVVYAGGIKREGRIGALFARLKVVNGKITESELLSRGGEPAASGNEPVKEMSGLLEPDLIYDTVVPEGRRSDRDKLVEVINGYVNAISQHNGSLAQFSYRCDRYNTGSKWTNNPDNPESRGGGTCPSSLNGLKGQAVVNVRFPVVDVEHGVVGVLFIIPHGEASPQRSTNVAELFKVVDGKIRSIEEFGGGGHFPPTSGFPDR